MITSPFCTLKVLSMRDNFIKQQAAGLIMEALKTNRTITKIHLDYNPIKQRCVEQIDTLCKRNVHLDEINEKNKNLATLAFKKQNANSQKECLTHEIKELKSTTDKTIVEAT